MPRGPSAVPDESFRDIHLIDPPEQYDLWAYENQLLKGELDKLFNVLHEIKVKDLKSLVKKFS